MASCSGSKPLFDSIRPADGWRAEPPELEDGVLTVTFEAGGATEQSVRVFARCVNGIPVLTSR
jgi:hypothetical protein